MVVGMAVGKDSVFFKYMFSNFLVTNVGSSALRSIVLLF